MPRVQYRTVSSHSSIFWSAIGLAYHRLFDQPLIQPCPLEIVTTFSFRAVTYPSVYFLPCNLRLET